MKLTTAEIEEIITFEIVVDSYTDEEVNMGWAIYMEENIFYPFEAEYEVKQKGGKRHWTKVMVVSNETDDTNFEGSSYDVEIEYEEILIPVELGELREIKADEETMKTLQIWQYNQNY